MFGKSIHLIMLLTKTDDPSSRRDGIIRHCLRKGWTICFVSGGKKFTHRKTFPGNHIIRNVKQWKMKNVFQIMNNSRVRRWCKQRVHIFGITWKVQTKAFQWMSLHTKWREFSIKKNIRWLLLQLFSAFLENRLFYTSMSGCIYIFVYAFQFRYAFEVTLHNEPLLQ